MEIGQTALNLLAKGFADEMAKSGNAYEQGPLAEPWPRRGTQAYRILSLLSSGDWVHMSRLNSICYRYGARLLDLKRKLGIEHEVMKDSAGAVWYRVKR